MHIQSLCKAVSVIELVAQNDCLNLEQLHIISAIPKPTLKRILDDFEELEWLYRRLADKKYVLLKDLANNSHTEYILAKKISGCLVELFDETNIPSDFLVKDKKGITIFESSFGLTNLRRCSENIIGTTLSPTLSASGRAFLSQLNAKNLEETVPDIDTAELFQSLEKEKERGFYMRIPGSWEFNFKKPFDIRSVALPISSQEEFIGCVNLYWDNNQHRSSHIIDRFIPSLEKCANNIQEIVVDHKKHATSTKNKLSCL